MSEDSTINAFLKRVKNIEKIIVIQTDKNRRTRFSLGITIGHQEAIVRNLKVEEYIKGPVDDYDKNRQTKLWVFKHVYEGHVLYIKITEIEIVEDEQTIRCLSCHIDNM